MLNCCPGIVCINISRIITVASYKQQHRGRSKQIISAMAKFYDKNRTPFGLNFIYRSLVAHSHGSLGSLHLLDIGCGTGTHTAALLKAGLGRATFLDKDRDALETAVAKVPECKVGLKVNFILHKLPDIPLDKESVDVCMANMVLNELETGADTEYGAVEKTLRECFRVLRPAGLSIGTLRDPDQLLTGYWMYALHGEEKMKAMKDHDVPSSVLNHMLEDIGFSDVEMYMPRDGLFVPESYYNKYDGIFDKEWVEYYFHNMKHDEDLAEELQQKYEELKRTGKLSDFLAECEHNRDNYGQAYMWIGRKPLGHTH